MRILQLISFYIPAFRSGGPVRAVHALNKALVGLGHSVTVLSTNLDGSGEMNVPLGEVQSQDGVAIWYFPSTIKKWEFSPKLNEKLRAIAGSFDVIHIHSLLRATSFFGSRIASEFSVPYVISPRGVLMTELLKRSGLLKKLYLSLVEQKVFRGAAALHFTTNIEADEYAKEGFPPRPSFIVQNCVDFDELHAQSSERGFFRRKYTIPDNVKLILFLGRLHWKKGFDMLIPAFAKLKKEIGNCYLAVVGPDDGYAKELNNLISRFGVSDSVIITGALYAGERASAFRDSDLFVLPSLAENFAVTVVEALSFGLPAVVSPGVGVAPFINEFGAGRVVDRDVEKLAGSLIDLLRSDDLRRSMGQRGRALAENKFSIRSVASQMITEYSKLVHKDIL